MQIKQTIEHNTAQLIFRGDLLGEPDGTTVRNMIHDLAGEHVKHVVIDLGAVQHINSAGLGALVAALSTMRKSGGDIRLARVGHNVQNILMITRLVRIFDTFDSVEEALKDFRIPAG